MASASDHWGTYRGEQDASGTKHSPAAVDQLGVCVPAGRTKGSQPAMLSQNDIKPNCNVPLQHLGGRA